MSEELKRNARNAGRRSLYGEPLDVHRQMSFTESQYELLQEERERTGVSIQELIRRSVLSTIGEDMEENYFRKEILGGIVPLLGEIPAGPPAHIESYPPGTYIKPPFQVDDGCYALMVRGDSMESEFGMSIKDGYYAIFCPNVIFPHAIVHVEFPDDTNQNATLKKYFPRPDGTVEFRPLNSKHKNMVKKEGDFDIKGGFLRAWDGISKE